MSKGDNHPDNLECWVCKHTDYGDQPFIPLKVYRVDTDEETEAYACPVCGTVKLNV